MTKGDENKDSQLTDKQLKAIPHLVASGTHEAGCRKAKITRNTFYKWLKDPAFKAELNRQRDEVIEDALATLKANIGEAVETLVSLLNDTESDSLKRLIANDIIGYTLRAKELEDLEKRINALEKALSDRKSK